MLQKRRTRTSQQLRGREGKQLGANKKLQELTELVDPFPNNLPSKFSFEGTVFTRLPLSGQLSTEAVIFAEKVGKGERPAKWVAVWRKGKTVKAELFDDYAKLRNELPG